MPNLHYITAAKHIVPEAVDYLGHKLPQHFIRSIAMCSAKLNGKEGVIVEVILGRPIFSKFLTVSSVHNKMILDIGILWREH